jgi:glycosyltransferase involved in cell wall biosynthesis
MALHVTFLTGEYPPMQGGIADYTAHLARHLHDLAVQPSVLINRVYEEHRQKGEGKDQLSQVIVYPFLHDWGARCWPEIKRFLRKYPASVLHIQYQAAAFDLKGWVNWLPWYLHHWRKRPKVVTTFHDLRIPYLFPKAGFLRWRSILALARYSDAVICTNREDSLTLGQFPWANHVTEIPLGHNVTVNPPPRYQRQTWRENLGFKSDSIVLAYFGFLNESKGGEDLIAALDILARRGLDVRLLMIGGDIGDSDPSNRAYAQRIHRLIAKNDLDQRIVFTGYVGLPEVSAHLLAADLAVMPYRDGVSFRRTTLITALRHGLPIISTTPAIELPQIAAGKNMLLVAPRDIAGLTEAVIRVVNDPSLREQLSQGAGMLGNQFDWPEIAAQTLRVYQSL